MTQASSTTPLLTCSIWITSRWGDTKATLKSSLDKYPRWNSTIPLRLLRTTGSSSPTHLFLRVSRPRRRACCWICARLDSNIPPSPFSSFTTSLSKFHFLLVLLFSVPMVQASPPSSSSSLVTWWQVHPGEPDLLQLWSCMQSINNAKGHRCGDCTVDVMNGCSYIHKIYTVKNLIHCSWQNYIIFQKLPHSHICTLCHQMSVLDFTWSGWIWFRLKYLNLNFWKCHLATQFTMSDQSQDFFDIYFTTSN